MKKLFIIATILSEFILLNDCSALSITEQYEMQGMCSKQSKEYFMNHKKELANTSSKDSETTLSFVNHYNVKANKCYLVISNCTMPTTKEAAKKYPPMCSYTLADVNEHRIVGGLMVNGWSREQTMYCKVNDKPCSSEVEWNTTLKPYMEE